MAIKVSILVPIYGVERYIDRCARSLFEQTYDNIEYIFVNDCTKDASIKILKCVLDEYPNRKDSVRIIEHMYNRGLAAARNTGVDAITGDYLMHVDSDDWLDFNAVKILVDTAERDFPDIILFGSKSVYKDREEISKVPNMSKEQYIKSILIHSIPASIWNKFYRTEFYKNSGIRSIEGIDHGEDYVVVPRLLHKASNFKILNKFLYYYNLTNITSYTKNITSKSISSLLVAANELYKYFTISKDVEIYKYQISILYMRTVLALVKMGNEKSYKDIRHIMKSYPVGGFTRISFTDKLLYILLKARLDKVLFMLIHKGKYLL